MRKTTLNRMTNPVIGALARNTISVVKKNKNKELLSNPVFLLLLERFARFDEALLRQYGTRFKQIIEGADLQRNQYYQGLCNFLHGYLCYGDERAEIAKKLLRIIDGMGALSKMNYTTRTVVLNKIIRELSEPENYEQLEKLNLVEIFELLKEANKNFMKYRQEKQETMADLRRLETATRLRVELAEALFNLFSFVKLMRHKPEWKDLYHDLEVVKKAARNARRVRERKGEEEDVSGDQPTGNSDQSTVNS